MGHKIINGIEYKKCPRCNMWLELLCFSKDKSKNDGLDGFCKKCKKEKDHLYYINNKEKIYKRVVEYMKKTGEYYRYKEYNPKYYSSKKSKLKKRIRDFNRRTLKKNANKNNKITIGIISKLLKKYNYKCAYCGKECNDYYEIDHIIPLVKGGTNEFNNLAISCKHCNCSKKDKSLNEFLLFKSINNGN